MSIGSVFAGYTYCPNRHSLPAHPDLQMVNAHNGEVQIHQSDLRNPPLHCNGVDSNYEREFKPCETLVEHRTKKQSLRFLGRILISRRFR